MNILFLTLGRFDSINQHSLYTDLLRAFAEQGHRVHVLCPRERRLGLPTQLVDEDGAKILHVRVGNITKTNLLEKGLSTLALEPAYIRAVKRYFSEVKFDLVLYSTPPVTFGSVVRFVKRRDCAQSYLLLKDIFPQNAVDLGMMRKRGLLYRFFRAKERKLYRLSDRIGCMSPANRDYLLAHDTEVAAAAVEVCPNSIEVRDLRAGGEQRAELRRKYGLPMDKTIFVYGGNLGRPQGIPFILSCLEGQRGRADAFFLIVGDGTEFKKLESGLSRADLDNVKLMRRLPKEEYDRLAAACDVGLIFLDHRFTIPNFPSRLLSYLQAGLPVLACTDPNTDVGTVITEGGFGWWCKSSGTAAFGRRVDEICGTEKPRLREMGDRGYRFLCEHYSSHRACQQISESLWGIKKESGAEG